MSNTGDSSDNPIEIPDNDDEELAAVTARTSLDDINDAARTLQQISDGTTSKESDIRDNVDAGQWPSEEQRTDSKLDEDAPSRAAASAQLPALPPQPVSGPRSTLPVQPSIEALREETANKVKAQWNSDFGRGK